MKKSFTPWIFTIGCPLFWILLCTLSPILSEDVPVTPKVSATELPHNTSGETEGEDQAAAAEVTDHVVSVENTGVNSAETSEVNDLNANGEAVVQSSFEGNYSPQQDYPFVEAVSQNAGIANGITDGTPGVVVTLVDTATAELQQRADLSSQNPDVDARPSNVSQVNPQAQQNATQPSKNATEPTADSPKLEPKENLTTEEIPSFSEWAQKQLEEAEKKREEVNSSAQNQHWNGRNTSNLRVRSKNYASPDCGAKIVAANPEAVSPSSVLSPSRDEYKLNACTNRIWFIVELCEAIQAKKIDLANFELFSSSPKDFSVSVSDRFPSREWSNVGQFTAKDERDVQSFDLHPHLFGKYIKVEMHSHHGSEHFCPISLFRVYGTSEFEVLEKEDQNHQDDDDDDETVDSEKGQSPKNLFSSATDAVISIVKKAAEVLGNKGNISNQTSADDSKNVIKYTPLISTCTTPSHIVVCDNCSDVLFGKVYELLSCKSREINNLLGINLIKKTLYNTPVCLQYGLDFHTKRTTDIPNIYSSYVKSFFPPRYLAALCNTVAIIESKVVLNVSNQLNGTSKEVGDIGEKVETVEIIETTPPLKMEELEKLETTNAKVDTAHEGLSEQIKPTKTQHPDIEIVENTHFVNHETFSEELKPTQAPHELEEDESSGENNITVEFESGENLDLDKLISDLENSTAANSTPSPPQIKESVFLRLSNRIKTLERNMSLSSQYLEELSRRYKKQVEEMQRLLEKTIFTLHEESAKKDERNDRLEEQIKHLTEVVEALVAERNNTFNPLHWLVLIIVSMFGIFTFCRRNERKFPNGNHPANEIQRRKSIDVINHNTPAKKQRRPSEEALKITGTYAHLLVEENDAKKKHRQERKRKKKKSALLQRSNSIEDILRRHTGAFNRQESAPPRIVEWVAHSNGIEDLEIPFVLEEPDNSHLQDMPLPKPLQESIQLENASNGDIPRRKISSPAFLRATATELRKLRKPSPSPDKPGHKKSSSVDETKRQKSPAPSTASVTLSLDDQKPEKKEKRGTFKKIFKKVF